MSTPSGRAQAQSLFNLCTPIVTNNDVYTFISNIADPFMETVQYNAEIRGQPTISDVCQYMINASDPLTGLVNVNSLFLQLQGLECLSSSYDNMVKELKNTTQVEALGSRQWTWQTCTEYVVPWIWKINVQVWILSDHGCTGRYATVRKTDASRVFTSDL